ncbi:unnamed protein product [Rangifer tarandus platyrhynchus]|uniref:Uncharacterized protein n=1 Tax=Rangifer tarandus platyrhynchus TaxID=3082113 RepID=A0ABN8Y798_RANTA|nr:unnamed protein product [Rangifer tarandus platyrhynchus]
MTRLRLRRGLHSPGRAAAYLSPSGSAGGSRHQTVKERVEAAWRLPSLTPPVRHSQAVPRENLRPLHFIIQGGNCFLCQLQK